MNGRKKIVFLVLAVFMLIAATGGTALAEIKKVKLNVPSCE